MVVVTKLRTIYQNYSANRKNLSIIKKMTFADCELRHLIYQPSLLH